MFIYIHQNPQCLGVVYIPIEKVYLFLLHNPTNSETGNIRIVNNPPKKPFIALSVSWPLLSMLRNINHVPIKPIIKANSIMSPRQN